MHLPRIFTLVGIGFGLMFVLVNAGGLPAQWDRVALAVAALLAAAAVWFGLVRRGADPVPWSGSARAYWWSVCAETAAIPLGALLLNRVLEQPDLVVLWVVFVVGAHFLPAKAFGIGRFAELGVALMLVAVGSCLARLVLDVEPAPSTGAVLAGLLLLGFAAVPALARPSAEGVR